MLKTDANSVRMWDSVIAVAASHETDINQVPALAKAFADFDGVAAAMAREIEITVSPSGAVDAKTLAIDTVVDAGLAIAGAVHAYAVEAGDNELAARTAFSPSSLRKGGPTKMLPRINRIAALAADNLEFLDDAKITQATLTAFGKKIDTASEAASKPRGNTTRRSAANQGIARLLRQGRRILKGRIDKLMLPFRESDPEFYAEYKAARRIVDLRTTAAAHSSAPVKLTKSRNGNGNGTTAPELTETTH